MQRILWCMFFKRLPVPLVPLFFFFPKPVFSVAWCSQKTCLWFFADADTLVEICVGKSVKASYSASGEINFFVSLFKKIIENVSMNSIVSCSNKNLNVQEDISKSSIVSILYCEWNTVYSCIFWKFLINWIKRIKTLKIVVNKTRWISGTNKFLF